VRYGALEQPQRAMISPASAIFHALLVALIGQGWLRGLM